MPGALALIRMRVSALRSRSGWRAACSFFDVSSILRDEIR